MKKITYLISVLLTSVFLTRGANAMWPDLTPVIPVAPQLCVMCIPPAISVAISYYDQVIELKEDLEKYTNLTTLKQMAVSYVSKMGAAAFNKLRQSINTRKRGISQARTIEESKIADVTDEASVKNAFIKLFLQYPSNKKQVKEAYESINKQLKMDTTLEMYLTAVEMEKKLYGDPKAAKDSKNLEDLGMLKQIDLIESCLVQGENCDVIELSSCQEKSGGGDDQSKEDKACFWNSALQAEKLYDEVMRNNLFLIAMHAQYQAVMGIDTLAKIKAFEDDKKNDKKKKKKKEKKSSLLNQYLQPSTNTAMGRMITAKVAFADLTAEEEEMAASDLSGYETELASDKNVIDGMFEDADSSESLSIALGDREDDVKSLQIIGEIREDLNKAQKLHNLKQTLPEYKKVYQDYADIQEKMKQAKDNLKASGECIINMMKPYYKNAEAVWFGGDCTYYRENQIICHYDPEKMDDDDSESLGDFDILCPGEPDYKCYIQEISSSNMAGGVAKYLLELYMAAKDEDAAGDTEAFIEESTESTEGGYGMRVQVTTGGKGSEVDRDADSSFVTSRNSDETMDEDRVDQMTTQTSEIDSEDAVSNSKDQKKGEEEKEQARKDGLIRWTIGSEVAKELALDLDTGEHEWGDRQRKFPLWNDQIAFYQQYIDGKYDNIDEYISTMSQTDILLKLANTLNEIYPYKITEDIPPIGPEMLRKKGELLLQNLAEGLEKLKQELLNADGEQENVENASATDGNQTLTFDDIYIRRIESAIAAENERIDAVRKNYEKQKETKQAELERWYAIMDEANQNLSTVNETYNKNNEVIKEGEATTPEASEGLDYSNKIYADRKLTQDSPQNADFNNTKTTNEQNSAVAREKQAIAQNKAEAYEDIVKKAEERAKKIKEELDEMRRGYVKRMSDVESDEKTKFANFTADLRAARQIDIWTATMAQVLPLDLSGRLLQCIRVYAQTKVAEARTEIQKMEDDQSIYYVSGAERLQEIHKKMIESITNIPLTELAECAALGEIKDFDENSDEDVGPVLNIFQDICKDDFCTTPDSSYFVGAIGLPQDFSAPKPPLDFSSAPLHEIFHFDVIDFNNVDKYYRDQDDVHSNKKMYTSFESFLDFLNTSSSGFEYGKTTYESTVPEVWKYILKRHAYVQKEMDLTALLGESEETAENSLAANNNKTILRAGIFPCEIEEQYAIDVDKPEKIGIFPFIKTEGKDDLYTYTLNKKLSSTEEEYANMPICRAISLEKEKGKLYIKDKESGRFVRADKISMLPEKNARGSELGTIMAYVADETTMLDALLGAKLIAGEIDRATLPHRLTFNQTFLDAIAVINETKDLTEDDEAAKFYMANRLLYDRNQFGDYLDQVEYENVMVDAVEKVKKQVDEINGKLSDVFAEAEYTMSDDFSLLNEQDYATASNVMDEQKNLYVDLAIQKLQNMPQGSGSSQNVRDKSLKLLHKIAVLQKDNEEIVTVTGDEELDELEEKIKTQKADNAVGDKYKEKEEAEEERQKKHVQAPYCSAYPPGENMVDDSFGGESKPIDVSAAEIPQSVESGNSDAAVNTEYGRDENSQDLFAEDAKAADMTDISASPIQASPVGAATPVSEGSLSSVAAPVENISSMEKTAVSADNQTVVTGKSVSNAKNAQNLTIDKKQQVVQKTNGPEAVAISETKTFSAAKKIAASETSQPGSKNASAAISAATPVYTNTPMTTRKTAEETQIMSIADQEEKNLEKKKKLLFQEENSANISTTSGMSRAWGMVGGGI